MQAYSCTYTYSLIFIIKTLGALKINGLSKEKYRSSNDKQFDAYKPSLRAC